MGGKKKNRKKSKSSQQNLKVMAARYRKEFLGQIKYFFNLWLGENTFSMLPSNEVKTLYNMHFTPPRFIPAEGSVISKKFIRELQELLGMWIDNNSIEISENLPKITIYQFLTYYITINYYLHGLKEERFANANEVKERYKKLDVTYDATMKRGFQWLDDILMILGMMQSDPNKCYYLLTGNFKDIRVKKRSVYLVIWVKAIKPLAMDFVVKGDKRPAYKFGIPLQRAGMYWKLFKPPEKESFRWKKKLEIYIQSHAINRLYERLESIDPLLIRFNLYISFFKPNMIYENNYLLIPYVMDNVTIGYFMAGITKGKILIRTFLFITNEGTPEARRLKENTGLNKLDVKYLNIDKIRVFIESDIVKDERLKNIFIEAGCGGLFDLNLDDPDAYNGALKLAEEMSKYLETEDEKENDSDNEISMAEVRAV
ncbi:MAG: hypothetical protein JEY97_07365 [Bacteroidales bacterium]|nr:hypothetical protein [Bacteroidales bacterium]